MKQCKSYNSEENFLSLIKLKLKTVTQFFWAINRVKWEVVFETIFKIESSRSFKKLKNESTIILFSLHAKKTVPTFLGLHFTKHVLPKLSISSQMQSSRK